jgi:hypothetical protein
LPEQYLAASDVPDGADLHGLIAFHFACFGAGTPRYDEYAYRKLEGAPPAEIAPRAMLSALPRRLLGHPNGGALAVIGHVERAWGCSFLWGRSRREQIVTFEEALLLLLDGYPVGAALEAMNQRYAECATTLGDLLEKTSYGLRLDPDQLVPLWTANNDARGYAIVGDPAVRVNPSVSAPVRLPSSASVTAISSAPRRGVTLPEAGEDLTPRPPLRLGEGEQDVASASNPASRGSAVAPRSLPLSAPERGPGGEVDPAFGLIDTDLRDSIRQLAERLAAALANASTLTVTTYTSPDLTEPEAGAKPVAVSRIGLLGDVEVFVPPQSDAIDALTWARHMDHVGGAQANRAALLAAAAEAATALARLLRPI